MPKEDLHPGAAQLSPRHLSVRVPWHDTDWTGHVCEAPSKNTDCLILENIHRNKDDAYEDELAGSAWQDLRAKQLPPCVTERAGFMRPYVMSHERTHPYARNRSHQHLEPTTLEMPAYSVDHARPEGADGSGPGHLRRAAGRVVLP